MGLLSLRGFRAIKGVISHTLAHVIYEQDFWITSAGKSLQKGGEIMIHSEAFVIRGMWFTIENGNRRHLMQVRSWQPSLYFLIDLVELVNSHQKHFFSLSQSSEIHYYKLENSYYFKNIVFFLKAEFKQIFSSFTTRTFASFVDAYNGRDLSIFELIAYYLKKGSQSLVKIGFICKADKRSSKHP